MRYRALGSEGAVVSAVSVELAPHKARPRPADWTAYLYSALESGVSTFEVAIADPALVDGLARALSAVERRLVFVAWRIGATPGGLRDFSAAGLTAQVGSAIARSGLGYLDAVLLDGPAPEDISGEAVSALAGLKARGLVRFVGVRGDGEAVEQHLSRGPFDLLATPFNLTSGWRKRNLLRAAAARDVAVLSYDTSPPNLEELIQAAPARGWRRRVHPLAGAGTYAFLTSTYDWTPDQICLAYALTEPSLSSVLVAPRSIAELEALALVPERELPPGLAAQIEMARFSVAPPAEQAPETRRRA